MFISTKVNKPVYGLVQMVKHKRYEQHERKRMEALSDAVPFAVFTP